MDENKFWIAVWGIIGIVVCTLIVSITLFNMSVNERISEMVAKGANPIQAACAINGSNGSGQAIICSKSLDSK